MTTVEAKKELSQYIFFKNSLIRISAKIDSIESNVYFPKTMEIKEEVTDGGLHKTNSQKIAELVDLKNQFQKMYLQSEKICLDLEERIYKIAVNYSALEANILTHKFIYGKNCERICNEINYSYVHTTRLYESAIKHYCTIREDEYRAQEKYNAMVNTIAAQIN